MAQKTRSWLHDIVFQVKDEYKKVFFEDLQELPKEVMAKAREMMSKSLLSAVKDVSHRLVDASLFMDRRPCPGSLCRARSRLSLRA